MVAAADKHTPTPTPPTPTPFTAPQAARASKGVTIASASVVPTARPAAKFTPELALPCLSAPMMDLNQAKEPKRRAYLSVKCVMKGVRPL